MAFLRMRQRAVTALFPHQGNKQFIIPKRFGLIPTDTQHKTASTNSVFRSNAVSGTLATTGFTLFRGNIPLAVTSVDQAGGANAITVNHGIIPAGENTTVNYDGTGDWVGDNGRKVGPFNSSKDTL